MSQDWNDAVVITNLARLWAVELDSLGQCLIVDDGACFMRKWQPEMVEAIRHAGSIFGWSRRSVAAMTSPSRMSCISEKFKVADRDIFIVIASAKRGSVVGC